MSWVEPKSVEAVLREHHYLGPIRRGRAWADAFGCIVVGHATSRRIPSNWLELIRWCITSREKNAGSRQWRAFVVAARTAFPEATTIVSYSDPSQGHTGALYRACNWLWAPTWHRLRPPPSGNGKWNDKAESVKDRWVFPLRSDRDRVKILTAKDDAVLRSRPWAIYREPMGADYKTFARLAA